MKVLVTGATGFVGKNLIQKIKQENELHILVRQGSQWQELGVKNIFVFSDNIEVLAEYLQSNKIDGIIHLASLYVAEHKSIQIRDVVLSNVYLGTALLESCKIAGVRWFLNIGTIWQNFNSPDYSDEYHPVNLYAASKQSFMTMAQYYIETSDIRFCTLKLCDTFGPNDTRTKIFSLFEQNAKSGEALDMSPGEQLLDIVNVDQVVESIIKLADKLNEGDEVRREYVVTSGKHISLRNLAKMYEQHYNVTLNINWGGRKYRNREVMKPYIGNRYE